MIRKRILVFAYSELGHACLKFLIERGENIVGVYTHEDAATENIWFPSVKWLCMETEPDIPVCTDDDLKSKAALNLLTELKPDLILSFYYRNMIPKIVLDMPPLGSFNMHGSLLPKYRGRAPVNWAILHGEKETGPTLHAMVEKADAGDIVDQESVPIGIDDTTAVVQKRVNEAAVKVLARQIENLKAGTAPRIRQDSSKASYFGRRRPEDGRIDWTQSALTIHNLVRAVTHPFPGAFTDSQGKKTYIWQTRVSNERTSATPAGQFSLDNGRLYAAGGDGVLLEILSLSVENDKEMSGSDFAKKYLKK